MHSHNGFIVRDNVLLLS
jgi:hypothetical protein